MTNPLPLTLLTAAALLFASCGTEAHDHDHDHGNTPKAPVKVESTIQEITKELESVKDAKTAEDADSKLGKLADQLKEGFEKLSGAKPEADGATSQPSLPGMKVLEQAKGLASKLSPGVRDAIASLTTQIQRIENNPELKKILEPVLAKITGLVSLK